MYIRTQQVLLSHSSSKISGVYMHGAQCTRIAPPLDDIGLVNDEKLSPPHSVCIELM